MILSLTLWPLSLLPKARIVPSLTTEHGAQLRLMSQTRASPAVRPLERAVPVYVCFCSSVSSPCRVPSVPRRRTHVAPAIGGPHRIASIEDRIEDLGRSIQM